MAIAERNATTTWEGALASGEGVVQPATGAFEGLPVTWAARTEAPDAKTSPEELCAAAHSSCFSMALALVLGERKLRPERLEVRAAVTLDEVEQKPTITTSALQVRGRVPGTTPEDFEEAVAEAANVCPVSRLFAGAQITVNAELSED